ncbi:MAG: alcohol dehydrogenase catalytic domain-containing protein [Nitrososphaerales archaeon]|jgi:alcohol dehydrogenase, propanol-preferring
MKALVLDRLAAIEDGPLEYREIDDPAVGPDEVLLRVSACGVCHSNLHLIEGDLKVYGIPSVLPIVPGHEVVGRVVGVGHGVKKKEEEDEGVQIGRRMGVSVIWSSCGRCEYCLSGDENLCPARVITGEHVDGGYAEYIRAKRDFVYPVPDGISDVDAATLFCPGVTAYRAVERARIEPGESVMVIGIGGVGHFSVQFAKLRGARVTAVDLSKAQLELASELGADAVALSSEVEEFVRSERPSKVIVHTPAPAAIELATKVVKSRGTILMAVFGQVPVGFGGEVSIVTSMAGTKSDLGRMMELVSQGRVKVRATGYPLREGADVLRRLKAGEVVGRAVLVP